ncbi:MAG TPA: FMN-binding protein, partial [Rectinemataceae bacterium]
GRAGSPGNHGRPGSRGLQMKLAQKKEQIGYVVVFTFAVCMVFVVVLAIANQVTAARVEANKRYAAHYAVLKAFGLAQASTPRSDVEKLYSERIEELPDREGRPAAYSAEIDGLPYIGVRMTGPGLWGSITAILAADPAAERIRGLEVLDQQETPGLGGRIGEPWFAEQFAGEKVGADGRVAVVQGSGKGDPDKENSIVDAVTGASRTSDFMAALVASALAEIRSVGGAK